MTLDHKSTQQAVSRMRGRDLFRLVAAMVAALAIAALVAGCERGARASDDVRGAGLPVAKLQPQAAAAAYEAALRESFDVDSALVLVVDPAPLPRDGSLQRQQKMDDAVVRALIAGGIVRSTCEPHRPDPKRAPQCPTSGPGYVVRFSDIYQMRGDSARLFVAAERFQTRSGIGPAGRFAFESGFQLVRRGGQWTVVAEGRRQK